MKSIKNLAFTAFLTIGTLGTAMLASCNSDECKDVVCQNGGTCVGGNCVCPSGYEGVNCETESAAKYVGSWTAADKEEGSAIPSYTATITKNTVTVLNIGEFSNGFFDNDVQATLNGTTLSIASQEPDNDGYSVSGNATYTAGTPATIEWTYKLTDPSNDVLNYTG